MKKNFLYIFTVCLRLGCRKENKTQNDGQDIIVFYMKSRRNIFTPL